MTEITESLKATIRLRLTKEDFLAINLAAQQYPEYHASIFEQEYDEDTDMVVFDIVFRSVPKKYVNARFCAFLIRTFKKG